MHVLVGEQSPEIRGKLPNGPVPVLLAKALVEPVKRTGKTRQEARMDKLQILMELQ